MEKTVHVRELVRVEKGNSEEYREKGASLRGLLPFHKIRRHGGDALNESFFVLRVFSNQENDTQKHYYLGSNRTYPRAEA